MYNQSDEVIVGGRVEFDGGQITEQGKKLINRYRDISLSKNG